MKIRSDRLDGFTPQEQLKKTAPEGKAFEQMLAKQIGQGQSPAQAAPVSSGQSLDKLVMLQGEVQEADESALLETLFVKTDEVLADWEQYARSLGSGNDRAAWNTLNGLDARLKDLSGEVGQLGARGDGLGTVINELEVLTATEKFKFNRGDYQ